MDLTPQAGYDGLYLNSTGKVALGHDLPSSQLHVKKDGVQLIIDAQQEGNGDAQIKFESTGTGLIGYDNSIPNQFVFTDGDVPEIVGAQLSIDQTGQVDIGYNVANLSTSQPTHNVALDVLQHVNASLPIMEQGQVLTHMPEGSIVMWSGWTTDLPEGWLCVRELTMLLTLRQMNVIL